MARPQRPSRARPKRLPLGQRLRGHNFLAATLVDQARRKCRTLFEVWYDFRNAFGSVPFELLWDALTRLGVPEDYVAMCKGLYESAAFVVGNAVDGTTDPVQLRVGVFQGCPLSPQLFNAAISLLLFALQQLPDTGVQLSSDDSLGVSAYADDLKIFSGIKRQDALVSDFLRWTGMAANPGKCCTMSVQRYHRGMLKAEDLHLQLDGSPIPALSMSASYTYLGIGDGFDHVRRRVELAPTLKLLKDDATALMQSGLAPWQVVKAVKTHLARGLRHLLRLPVTATAEWLYAPASRGGLGLLPLTELHAALQVAHGWQILHTKDPAIRRIARVQLRQIADARHRLDAHAWEGVTRSCARCSSTPSWARRRTHHRSGVTGTLAHSESTSSWLDHRTVLRHVKLHIKHKHWRRWAEMRDQGKTARAHGETGSVFLTRPRGLWESDYRFAVAARLNQLDTHMCARSETLAHVLNHCPCTMDAVCGRHDDALKTIERALVASSSDSKDRVEIRTNQTVPSLAGPALRPDLQLYNHTKRTVAVVDLAVAFEEQADDGTESSALARIAAHKRTKYGRVQRHLERQGWKVHLPALVYGSWVRWHPADHKVYTEQLGLLKRDAKRLDSRRIWNLHCSQHRDRQQQRHQNARGSRVTEKTGGTPSQLAAASR
ncbi:reverse transcriptase [Phytophthora megakarya]|uniref:Reverse transcriptase n=1 Tax=Phytophthora megakarya TaxID=4795 RepID=A0A225VVS0_9STRA|nr:reverse transcriptase [Phytophthora megakarya]